MRQKMRCPRCGNEDRDLFFHDRGSWYCRRCIAFGRIDVNERLCTPKWERRKIVCAYHLPYALTDLQQQVVTEVCWKKGRMCSSMRRPVPARPN